MEEQPLVSVVIPAYNCEKYIADTLDSVINQTYKNLEIIVVNDCSTDGTQDVIDTYLKMDNRIFFLQNNVNCGVAESRNRGVNISKGKYIAFLDSDDLWKIKKIGLQVELLERTKEVFCYTSYEMVEEDGKTLRGNFVVPNRITYKGLLYKNVINTSSILVKQEVVKNFPMKRDDLHEDYITWLAILKKYDYVIGIEESLTVYRLLKDSRANNKLRCFRLRNEVYKLENINFIKRCYYLFFYAIGGVVKYWI